jgi:hypothetical protein
VQALLKFGRDSGWPLRIISASALDEETAILVTYASSWEDCDGTATWARAK